MEQSCGNAMGEKMDKLRHSMDSFPLGFTRYKILLLQKHHSSIQMSHSSIACVKYLHKV